MNTIDNTETGIAMFTGDQPPVERVRDAQSGREILTELLKDDMAASCRRADIQGMIDGNPPYKDEDLKQAGLAETINVNWGHAEGEVDNATLPYFDMLTSVPTYARVETNYGKKDSQKEKWSRIITQEFHDTLKSDPNFLIVHQQIQKNIVIHGAACAYHRDSLDWRAHSTLPWNLVAPRDASVEWNSWEYCFLLDFYKADELYRFIENEEAANRMGWDVEAVKEALRNAQIVKDDKHHPWEFIQNEIKNNGLFYSTARSKVIQIAHMYVREFSGKITHYIFDRNGNSNWLCKKLDRYDDYSQAFSIFLNGCGNGSFHGVRGLGQKVFKFGQAINRVNNAILEKTIIDSATMLQAKSASDVSKLESITIGPWRILPSGISPIAVNTNSNLSGALQVASFFASQENKQNASYLPTMDSNGRKLSNKEHEAQLTEKSALTNTRAEYYMIALDLHYAEVYRRMSNPNLLPEDSGAIQALRFQENCIKRGVPKAALTIIKSVEATRSIGKGSPAARVQSMHMIGQFISMLPENKRIAVIRDSIAAIGGQKFVDAYAPDENNQPTGNDASIASLENNAFLMGGQVVIDPNQNHYIHCTIHLKFFSEIVAAVKQQKLDPTKAEKCFEAGGPHLLLHLKYLKDDPTRKKQFETLNRQASELMKIGDQIAKLAERLAQEQQNQQPQQQPDPKMLVAQNTIELSRQKAQSDMQIKNAKAEQQMRLKDKTTAQRLQITNINHEQKQREYASMKE